MSDINTTILLSGTLGPTVGWGLGVLTHIVANRRAKVRAEEATQKAQDEAWRESVEVNLIRLENEVRATRAKATELEGIVKWRNPDLDPDR